MMACNFRIFTLYPSRFSVFLPISKTRRTSCKPANLCWRISSRTASFQQLYERRRGKWIIMQNKKNTKTTKRVKYEAHISRRMTVNDYLVQWSGTVLGRWTTPERGGLAHSYFGSPRGNSRPNSTLYMYGKDKKKSFRFNKRQFTFEKKTKNAEARARSHRLIVFVRCLYINTTYDFDA